MRFWQIVPEKLWAGVAVITSIRRPQAVPVPDQPASRNHHRPSVLKATDRISHTCLAFVCLTLLLLLAPNTDTLQAQSGTGSVSGTIRDESGSVLPGTAVSVRNQATNATRRSVTNDFGVYRIPALLPGSYEIDAQLPGFQTTRETGVIVTVGEVLTVNLVLRIGEISDTVLVEDSASPIDMEDSQLSSLVDDRRIQELPLNGRNIFALSTLQPGVIAPLESIANAEGPNSAAFFAAGSRFRGNNFVLDGLTINDESTAGIPAVTPILDTVQEFRLIRNNFSAEFGTHSGAVVNVVTKSGTNEFHGSAWEFHRDESLDASEVFAPFNTETGEKEKTPLVQNQFGFTLGGPIVKDELFFFGAYEGFRQRTGQSQRTVVETPEFRQWVIENNPDSFAARLFQSFPAPHPTMGIQTAADLNPEQTSIVNPLIPPDDLPVLGQVDTFSALSRDTDQFNLRLDHVMNEGQDLIFGRYVSTDLRGPDTTARGAFGDRQDDFSQNVGLAYIRQFSPNLINEARFGYLYSRVGFVPGSNPEVPAIVIDGPAGIFGAMGGNVGFPAAFGSVFAVPQVFRRHTFQWQDVVSIQKGRHSIRAGVDFRRLQENGNFADRSRPFFVYQGIFDFANDAPLILQAGVNPATGALTDTPRFWRSTEIGWFIQDDWKLHPRFTLNLGVRWDYFQPVTEKNGLMSNISYPTGAGYFERVAEASVGVVDSLYERDLNNFAPRLGFAWDFLGDGRTVLRGGYGVSYDKLFFNIVGNVRFNPPHFGRAQLSPLFGNEIEPFLGSDPSDPFGGFIGHVIPGADLGLDSRGGIVGTRVRLSVIDPEIRDSYVHNLFLGIQRRLPGNTVAEVNYQGTLGRKLPFFGDPNRFTGDRLGHPDPLGRFEGDTSENRLNPSFESFNLRQNKITSNYHGFNAQLTRRFQDLLSFQIAYTFGKVLDYGSDFFGAGNNSGGLVGQSFRTYHMDPLNIELDYGRAAFDVRQRLVTNFLWEIPFFANRRDLVGSLLGGWNVQAIIPIQSGLPFNVLNSATYPSGGDYNADGQEGDRPNAPSFGNEFGTAPSTSRFIDGVFSREDFPAPESGDNGTLGRNTFTGPSYWTVDLSLMKRFALPITEDTNLEFRADFFNLFNRVNLFIPAVDMNSPVFGQSTQSFDARQIQLALKLSF